MGGVGILAAQGALLAIGLAISFVVMVVGLFIGHIIIFDSIALGIISGVCCNHFTDIHPALCLLIGAAVFAGLLFLQKRASAFGLSGYCYPLHGHLYSRSSLTYLQGKI